MVLSHTERQSFFPKLSLGPYPDPPVVRCGGCVQLLYDVPHCVHVVLQGVVPLFARRAVQNLGKDFGKGFSELNEPDQIVVPLILIWFPLQDRDRRRYAGILKPLLHLRLYHRDYSKVAKEEFLELEPVVSVQPADAGYEAQVPTCSQKVGPVGEEIGVYVGAS